MNPIESNLLYEPKPNGSAAGEPDAEATSPWAKMAVFCGVLGCTGIGEIGALICGCIALRKIRHSSGRVRGAGLAWLGMALGIALCLPVAIGAVSVSRPLGVVQRMWLIRTVGEGLRNHAQEHGGKFVGADDWTAEIMPYLRALSESRMDAKILGATNRYCLNSRLAGTPVDRVSPNVVLLFELQTPGVNVSGSSFGPNLAITAPAVIKGRVLVLFGDGHCEVIPSNRLSTLRWNP